MICRCRCRQRSSFPGARRVLLLSFAAAVTVVLATLPLATAKNPLASSLPKISGRVNSAMPGKMSPVFFQLRGGSTDPPSASYGGRPSNPPPPPPPYQPQQPQQQDPYLDPQLENELDIDDNNVPFHDETFQDKVDSWREYQRQHAAEFQSNLSPRDEKGRMKLLTSVSKGSRAITFFIYMWRCVHLYEVVDQTRKGTLRFMGVLPLTFLFVANMAGVVASISPGHGAKKRLKAILNLDKLLELFLIVSSLMRLIFAPSNLIPREVYISHIMHSVFFIIQCQTVTRFVWDDGIPTLNTQQRSTMSRDDNDPLIMERADPNDPYRY